MANIKISELNELTSAQVNNDDVLPIVDISSDETKKITIQNIREGLEINVQNSYTESNDDTYSCNYINNINLYSTSETFTGEYWIDNKKIYRKVITGLSISPSPSGVSYSNSSFSTIENLIEVKMTRNKSGSVNEAVAVCSGVLAGNNLSIYAITEFSNCNNLILEYTKTSD